jgi:Secretion system C-terminal sorting domain
VSDVSSGTVSLVSNASVGNQWYKNGVVITSATADRITVTEDGVYTVKITVDNCSSQLSDERPIVIPVDQTITFSSIPAKTLGDPSFTLSATATSALPVVYSTTSDKISINGNQVTLIKPGTTNVTASQPGNEAFIAADPVTQTFCVNPPKPIIVVSDVSSGTVSLVSNASVGNQWYKNGAVITSATADRITVTEVGIYTVKVTVDNCSSQLSSTDHSATNLVYPNPVRQNITVNLHAFDLNHEVEIIIYDAIGNLKVRTVERGHESTTFSVDDLPTGLYVVKARQHGLTQTEKFLKD